MTSSSDTTVVRTPARASRRTPSSRPWCRLVRYALEERWESRLPRGYLASIESRRNLLEAMRSRGRADVINFVTMRQVSEHTDHWASVEEDLAPSWRDGTINQQALRNLVVAEMSSERMLYGTGGEYWRADLPQGSEGKRVLARRWRFMALSEYSRACSATSCHRL